MNTIKEKLSSLFFYLSILIFLIGFNFTDSPPPSGWYQQWMPNLSGRQVNDIAFTDSLNGYAITNRLSVTDSSFILKTTNGGDNWFLAHSDSGVIYSRIQFINQNTGFVGGYIYKNSSFWIVKTTDKGFNWFYITAPFDVAANDMFVLNQDTIWIADNNQLVGGLFRTTNGGTSWIQQYHDISNPSHIYMYNARIGFMDGGGLKRTSDGGNSWSPITGEGIFYNMYFIDTLNGWKSGIGFFKVTSNSGFNWTAQSFPQGNEFLATGISRFSTVNKDSLWGVGGILITQNGNRAIIYKTTNSGNNWLYQIPDTSIHIFQYAYNKFVNKLNGWAYAYITGVHTVTGGDSISYTGIRKIKNITPVLFALYQNYPNPFNPSTKLSYELKKGAEVKLKVFDITGKLIETLVNQNQREGKYEITFDGSNLSSGVYFYKLEVRDDKEYYTDTKKMVLLK